ncbi:MAG: FAD-dependent thymidylate synthase [Nitratireductor sp.]|uniref:FAD-dependent thymidylate synthase n=1 Tax=Nitratireductor sp. TaxID=1872084 RepID=UPI00260D11E1|nr:FAD-dependent thymidylate synthase [Nitratireductor sp.]MCV0350160.1 FAD-dependent thymidylate synthase [Nitratireductor sp.]
MTITAKIIADSISPQGHRLTTMELRYPRFIHSEFMTHRVFSRNASSSRAIPVERMIQDVIDDTAMPIHWGKNQPGMQAAEENDEFVISHVDEAVWVPREEVWCEARDRAIETARAFTRAGYHKQIVNRLLEPFMHINVVVTATDWDNFFTLRLHPDAQPEIHELARCMKKAMDESCPKKLHSGEWYLPYTSEEDVQRLLGAYKDFPDVATLRDLKILSVARCASVSYKTVDGKPMTMERAQLIYDKLVKADVFHASPFEHQATPDESYISPNGTRLWNNPGLQGNFLGWVQNRKLMETGLTL